MVDTYFGDLIEQARGQSRIQAKGRLYCNRIFLYHHSYTLSPREPIRASAPSIVLLPANSRLSPIELDPADVTVFGKVVTVLRRL